MSEHEHGQYPHNEIDKTTNHPGHWHRLKRIHHTWSFWIVLILMFAAITFYIMSGNFSRVPNHPIEQPIESPVAP